MDLPGADTFLLAASSEIEPTMGQGQPKPNPAMGQSRSLQNEGWVGSKTCLGAVSGCGTRATQSAGTPRLSPDTRGA
jgi:hypothetical protein